MPLTVTASAPGRICLAGESLDWMIGGCSITSAIPQRTRVTVWRGGAKKTLTLSSGSPIEETRLFSFDEVALCRYDGSVLDYLRAAAELVFRSADSDEGVTVLASSELPAGGGVSSSAALTLATTAALLCLLTGEAPCLEEVWHLAYRAEVAELGAGGGWMDFVACGLGGVNHVAASENPSGEHLLPLLGIPVVLVDTRRGHNTTAVVGSEGDRLRAGDPKMLAYLREDPCIVDELHAELKRQTIDYERVGWFVSEEHKLLAGLLMRSTDLIDTCIARVASAGALGAKLVGSGHGGCLFALVPDDATTKVLASLEDLPVHAVVLPQITTPGVLCGSDGAHLSPLQRQNLFEYVETAS